MNGLRVLFLLALSLILSRRSRSRFRRVSRCGLFVLSRRCNGSSPGNRLRLGWLWRRLLWRLYRRRLGFGVSVGGRLFASVRMDRLGLIIIFGLLSVWGRCLLRWGVMELCRCRRRWILIILNRLMIVMVIWWVMRRRGVLLCRRVSFLAGVLVLGVPVERNLWLCRAVLWLTR